MVRSCHEIFINDSLRIVLDTLSGFKEAVDYLCLAARDNLPDKSAAPILKALENTR
jgi:hypothetical protein